jgi:hypothetical protein
MNTLVRAAVAFAAALLGLGGFVAVQAATGPDDQQAAKREDSLAALTTVDDTPSPDATPSPDDSPSPEDGVVQQDTPAVQDDAVTPGADDPSTRTRTGHDAVTSGPTNDPNTSGPTDDVDTSGSDTRGDDDGSDDDRSGSGSGRG